MKLGEPEGSGGTRRLAVAGFRVWNQNEIPARGFREVSVYASDDGRAWLRLGSVLGALGLVCLTVLAAIGVVDGDAALGAIVGLIAGGGVAYPNCGAYAVQRAANSTGVRYPSELCGR